MHRKLKQAMLMGASFAFIAISGATLTASPAQAGPLAVAPKHSVTPASLTETVQYRRSARSGRVGVRQRAVRHRTVRAAPVYRGGRYVYRRSHSGAFVPAAVLGLFAGALGAAAIGSNYYCDPYYYTWNYCRGYAPAYYGGYSPVVYGGYYPAYRGGYYPAYRTSRVVYRSGYQRPRTVRYRAVAPRRHFVGARTHVRSGYTVRRARR
jgi:hypothetical protein